MANVIFIHGTGVRDEATFNTVKAALPNWNVVHCFWGESHGVKLNRGGGSIPNYVPVDILSEENQIESQWELLYRDPLYELRHLTSPSGELEEFPFNRLAPWEELKARIESYQPAKALSQLLKDAQLDEVWTEAFGAIIHTKDFESAARKLPSNDDQTITLVARAVVASLIVTGMEKGRPLPDGDARDAIVEQLAFDFGRKKYRGALEKIITYYVRPLTWYAERRRAVVSDKAFPFAGDVLLYQRRGDEIRAFIETAILSESKKTNGEKVILLAHSLGGIASFELLAMKPDLPVKALITVGSQAPLLYEMDCLYSLRCDDLLPEGFPSWLNVFDRQDLLSYIGESLFPGKVEDFEVKSRQPFPISHSAYWKIADLWEKVVEFVG
jgi:hypothetical protein